MEELICIGCPLGCMLKAEVNEADMFERKTKGRESCAVTVKNI